LEVPADRAPSRRIASGVIGSMFAVPRMPSVPNSLRWLLADLDAFTVASPFTLISSTAAADLLKRISQMGGLEERGESSQIH
jgi:hypothetical protein